MTIIPEKALLGFLRTCVDLSVRTLDELESSGASKAAPRELLDEYAALIRELHAQKRNDTILADESWEWIWEVKPDLNVVQLYGRLAWLNYTLLDLL